jgi:hypothetical protein
MQALFASGLSLFGSSVVFAVAIQPPHDGASRASLPRCETHAKGTAAADQRWRRRIAMDFSVVIVI